jgi:hypothetical protein
MLPSARLPWLTDVIHSIAPGRGPVVSANARSYIAEGPPWKAALLLFVVWQMVDEHHCECCTKKTRVHMEPWSFASQAMGRCRV